MDRIQRTRRKKQPPKTMYCGRPTKWGNPYRIINNNIYKYNSNHESYYFSFPSKSKEILLRLYEDYLKNELKKGLLDLDELRNYKHLSCWCKLSEPCHVDVILRFLSDDKSFSRHSDKTWQKCECGWQESMSEAIHGYKPVINTNGDDVVPVDYCPKCENEL